MNLFSSEFKSTFGKMIAWFLVLSIFVGLMLLFHQVMLDEKMKDLFDNFTNTLSPNMQAFFGVEEKIDYSNISEYIAFIYQYIAVLIAMFAMQLGAGALSREQGSGNIEYIYSNPITRHEIVTKKLISSIATYIFFLVLLGIATFGISYTINTPNTSNIDILIGIIKIFIGLLAVGLIYIGIGYFFSSMSKTAIHSESISVLFVILTVILVIAGKILKGATGMIGKSVPLEVFKPIFMIHGNLDIIRVAINIVFFAVILALTYLIYNKKELKF